MTAIDDKIIEIHFNARFYRDTWKKYLQGIIPTGLRILLRRLEEREGGEKLHNRYILTNLGAVSFSTGLDEGDDGQTDDVRILTREEYIKRWSQYYEAPVFDIKGEPIEIIGRG